MLNLLDNSWKDILKDEFQKDYFLKLIDFIETEYGDKAVSILPEKTNLFKAFESCRLDDVKVVILGQDPYPTKGHANGLCFSVQEEIFPFPKSLKNIFIEIQSDLQIPFPENGSLERWAKQGVLLLNTVLTVREGCPGSHANKGWEKFTDAVISALNKNKSGIVYFLWGSKAQEKGNFIDPMNNCILKTVHPSPLSCYKGFFGCKHFSIANDYLLLNKKTPIKW